MYANASNIDFFTLTLLHAWYEKSTPGYTNLTIYRISLHACIDIIMPIAMLINPQ